jgi:hypothetical protein
LVVSIFFIIADHVWPAKYSRQIARPLVVRMDGGLRMLQVVMESVSCRIRGYPEEKTFFLEEWMNIYDHIWQQNLNANSSFLGLWFWFVRKKTGSSIKIKC